MHAPTRAFWQKTHAEFITCCLSAIRIDRATPLSSGLHLTPRRHHPLRKEKKCQSPLLILLLAARWRFFSSESVASLTCNINVRLTVSYINFCCTIPPAECSATTTTDAIAMVMRAMSRRRSVLQPKEEANAIRTHTVGEILKGFTCSIFYFCASRRMPPDRRLVSWLVEISRFFLRFSWAMIHYSGGC